MLIVDDGSTDNTFEIVKGFVERDERIKYFYQDNQGSSVARNTGIRKSTGDYIAFLDSDDEWFSEKIHRQLIFHKQHANPNDVTHKKMLCAKCPHAEGLIGPIWCFRVSGMPE